MYVVYEHGLQLMRFTSYSIQNIIKSKVALSFEEYVTIKGQEVEKMKALHRVIKNNKKNRFRVVLLGNIKII